RTIEERIEAAQKLVASEPQDCPVVVDDISNQVNEAYAALPERLFIILDNVVVYQGEQGPLGYKVCH
ncbi:UNVERIFIED_CONTAM: hypothetical protein GTU68_020680, partial [Idotea baltica]|nr:hypothetical protein [Idotea baltica]